MTLYNNKILQTRLKILRSKSWAIQGNPIVDKGPHGEGRPCYNGDRERTEDTGLLALKLERGGMSQGLSQSPNPGRWKGIRSGSFHNKGISSRILREGAKDSDFQNSKRSNI